MYDPIYKGLYTGIYGPNSTLYKEGHIYQGKCNATKMKKVLLIAPNAPQETLQANWNSPPLGVHSIAAYLRKHNIEVDVLDPMIDDVKPEKIKEQVSYYNVIGFSVLNETLVRDIELIKQYKHYYPNSLLVCGGVEASSNYETIFDKSPCDVVVTAEGEHAMLMLIWGIHNAKGTIWRRYAVPITNNKLWECWDKIDFSKMRYEEYWAKTASYYENPDYEKINTVRLVTESHCNRGCSFCSVSRRRLFACNNLIPPAILSSDQIKKLVWRIKEQVPDTKTVYFCGDDLCINKERFDSMLEWMSETNLKYLIQTHPSKITEKDMYAIVKAGVKHITFGVENISYNVLQEYGKTIDLDSVPDKIRWCIENNIVPYILIILFGPNSTIKDLWINYETLTKWIKLGAQTSIEPVVMIYKHTPYYEMLYDFHYEMEVYGSTSIKKAKYIIPKDIVVKKIAETFMAEKDLFIQKSLENEPHLHAFKGYTGKIYLQLLKTLLERHSVL